MAINIGVHAVAAANNVTSVTTAGINTQASGSTIFIGVASTTAFSSVADNKGNTYVICGTAVTNALGLGFAFRRYRCVNATGGSGHTFTYNVTTSGVCTIWVVEITGADTTESFDKEAQQNDASSPFDSPDTATLSQADELLIGFCMDDSSGAGDTFTAGNGFTKIDEEADGSIHITGATSYKIVAATTGTHSSFTSAQGTQMEVSIDTFKQASAGGGGPTLPWLPVTRVVRGQQVKIIASGMTPPDTP